MGNGGIKLKKEKGSQPVDHILYNHLECPINVLLNEWTTIYLNHYLMREINVFLYLL